jgi:ATP-dependent Clp protease ATP-binding subunit ClpC
MGFKPEAGGEVLYDEMKEAVTAELKRTFRPEFLNRVDDVIIFHELKPADIKAIVDIMIAGLQARLGAIGLKIKLTGAAKDVLAKEGYDPTLGARPLRRALQRMVEDPLSETILKGKPKAGESITVDADNGKIVFVKGKNAKPDKLVGSKKKD